MTVELKWSGLLIVRKDKVKSNPRIVQAATMIFRLWFQLGTFNRQQFFVLSIAEQF